MALPMKEKKYEERICEHCEGSGFEGYLNPAWLREKRENENITLRAFAKELDVSAAYLSDIELGKREGNPEIIKAYENL